MVDEMITSVEKNNRLCAMYSDSTVFVYHL